jgi:hypothetical protein
MVRENFRELPLRHFVVLYVRIDRLEAEIPSHQNFEAIGPAVRSAGRIAFASKRLGAPSGAPAAPLFFFDG